MAFLTITKGSDHLDLEIETESARELAPETVGSVTRSFAGTFRGDLEEFRAWSFIAVNLSEDDYDDLRDMCAGAAAVVVTGDAMGGLTTVNAIVEVGEAPFVDDVNGSAGFSRTAALTIRQG